MPVETPITLEVPNASLGELLERLSRVSGSVIRMNDRHPMSGMPVAARFQSLPLPQVLAALRSLLSYRDAEWNWERRFQGSAYHYRLNAPEMTQEMTARWRQETWDDFEAYGIRALQALSLPIDRRTHDAKQDPLLAALLSNTRMMAGLRLFSEVCTPEQQTRILRGQEAARAPLDTLSLHSQTFLNGEYTRARATHDGEEPTTVIPFYGGWAEFKAARQPGYLAPDLFLRIEGVTGLSCLGGTAMEQAFRRKMLDRWTLRGDSRSHAQEGFYLPVSSANGEENNPLAFLHRSPQNPSALPVSYVSALPIKPPIRVKSLYTLAPKVGQTLGDYLGECRNTRPFLMRKWRYNVLVLSPCAWFRDEEAYVPYGVLKELRRAARENGGRLSPEDRERITVVLRAEQLHQLSEEFPELKPQRGV